MISEDDALSFVQEFDESELRNFILDRLRENTDIPVGSSFEPEDHEDVIIQLLESEKLSPEKRDVILSACDDVWTGVKHRVIDAEQLPSTLETGFSNLCKVINVAKPSYFQGKANSMLIDVIENQSVFSDKTKRAAVKAFIAYPPSQESKTYWINALTELPQFSAYIFTALLDHDAQDPFVDRALAELWKIELLDIQETEIEVIYLTEKAARRSKDPRNYLFNIFDRVRKSIDNGNDNIRDYLDDHGKNEWVRYLASEISVDSVDINYSEEYKAQGYQLYDYLVSLCEETSDFPITLLTRELSTQMLRDISSSVDHVIYFDRDEESGLDITPHQNFRQQSRQSENPDFQSNPR